MLVLNSIKNFYISLIRVGNWWQSPLLLIMRLFWGYMFYTTGMGKLENIKSIISFFSSLGIPWPQVNAYAVAYIETIGGICLVVGAATRLVAIPLLVTMVVALFSTSWKTIINIFSDPQGFIVLLPVTFLIVLLVLFTFGPGILSVDYFIQRVVFKRTER